MKNRRILSFHKQSLFLGGGGRFPSYASNVSFQCQRAVTGPCAYWEGLTVPSRSPYVYIYACSQSKFLLFRSLRHFSSEGKQTIFFNTVIKKQNKGKKVSLRIISVAREVTDVKSREEFAPEREYEKSAHILSVTVLNFFSGGQTLRLAACSIGHSSERIGNVVFRVWLFAVYDIAAGWLLWCVLEKRKRKFQNVQWTWFSSRTVMLCDELHVRFGFIHVELSIRSMLMVDLLYTKENDGKKRWCLAVSDLQASTR